LARETEQSLYDDTQPNMELYLESIVTLIVWLTDPILSECFVLFRYMANTSIDNFATERDPESILCSELIHAKGDRYEKQRMLAHIADEIRAMLPFVKKAYQNKQSICGKLPRLTVTIPSSLKRRMNQVRIQQLNQVQNISDDEDGWESSTDLIASPRSPRESDDEEEEFSYASDPSDASDASDVEEEKIDKKERWDPEDELYESDDSAKSDQSDQSQGSQVSQGSQGSQEEVYESDHSDPSSDPDDSDDSSDSDDTEIPDDETVELNEEELTLMDPQPLTFTPSLSDQCMECGSDVNHSSYRTPRIKHQNNEMIYFCGRECMEQWEGP
jgi:hypothetical protein